MSNELMVIYNHFRNDAFQGSFDFIQDLFYASLAYIYNFRGLFPSYVQHIK